MPPVNPRPSRRSGASHNGIDQGQPLIVALDGSATHPSLEPLDKLRADGLLTDFMTMVKSVRKIPPDPANVLSPLK